MTKILFTLLIGLFLMVFICGCSNESSDSGLVTVSGVLPGPISRTVGQNTEGASRDLSSAVTKIGAFPIVTDGISDVLDQEVETVPTEDNNFSLVLDTENDWIILLVNENAQDKRNLITGFISMQNGNETIVRFPVSYAVSDIGLGTLEEIGDEVSSNKPEALSSFELSSAELEELAKIDKVFKMIKNRIMNYDPDRGISYTVSPRFDWASNQSGAVNQYAPPPGKEQFLGYKITIQTNDISSLDYDDIINRNSKVTLYPPEGMVLQSVGDLEYSKEKPISNFPHPEASDSSYSFDGSWWSDEDFAVWTDGYSQLQFDCAILAVADPILAEGYWSFAVADPPSASEIELAVFDLGSSSPFDADGNINVYIPSLYIEADPDTKQITGIRIKWYTYDSATSGYQEIDPEGYFKESISNLNISFDDFSGTASFGSDRITDGYSLFDESFSDLVNAWYLSELGSNSVPEAESIIISYAIDDLRFLFFW